MDPFQKIIIDGFKLLKQKQRYMNKEVVGKLETLGYKISESSFTKILKEKNVGNAVLKKAYAGIVEIIESELGYRLDGPEQKFILMESSHGWAPEIIPLPDPRQLENSLGVNFYDKGRLSIQEKVEFINTAKEEVVEMGVRLRTFVDYFRSRSDHEFAEPVRNLLKRGVNFKLYILDPSSNETLLYFNDRAKVSEEEGNSVEVIKDVIMKLNKIQEELLSYSFPGKFEVYSYKHIPYNHFFIIDGETRFGKMMVSNYLYGIKRADCPVIQVSKQSNRSLYRRYFLSYKALVREAKNIKTEI